MQDEQRRNLLEALLKLLGVAVLVGLVVGLVAFAIVRTLGLGHSTPAAHSTSTGDPGSPSALPTVALSGPGGSSTPTPARSPTSEPTKAARKGIRLVATPLNVPPGGRINLTGRYRGQDNISLQVQRRESGAWTQFADVRASVRVGSFATYVLTSHQGANVFRVLDPTTGKASNAVTVNVG